MKIAHIIKDLVVGGIQSQLLDIMHYSMHNNKGCILICIGDGELKETFEKLGQNVVFIKKKYPLFDPVLIFKLRRFLIKEKIDIVHAHHISEAIVCYFASRGLPVKTVLSLHAAPAITNKQDNFLFKKMAFLMDACIVPSLAQLIALKKRGYPAPKITVIHNGIWPNRIDKKNAKKNMRKELGLPENSLLLGMIGNFYNATRDQLTVCKALPLVFKKFPNAYFIFWGGHTNPYSKSNTSIKACLDFCENAGLTDKVFFPGIEKDTASIYAALNLFVYASQHDTFGIAFVEAMFNKVPVVINDLELFCEITESRDHAYYYPTGQPTKLAEAIIKALTNHKTTCKKTDDAYRHVSKKYHIAQHIQALDNFYKKIN